VDVSQADPQAGVAAVLRPGGVSLAELSLIAGETVVERQSEAVRAPGQLASHYAPAAPVRLVPARELVSEAATLSAQGLRVAVLTDDPGGDWPPGVVPVHLPSEPMRAAHRLYAALREVDQRGCHVALTTLPLPEGLGLAVADRLRKAAGPRP
jgi:L-threonylcarbamoyladenylate synthase